MDPSESPGLLSTLAPIVGTAAAAFSLLLVVAYRDLVGSRVVATLFALACVLWLLESITNAIVLRGVETFGLALWLSESATVCFCFGLAGHLFFLARAQSRNPRQ